MASELKPCLLCEGEAKILRRSGTAGRACPSKWYRERVECKVCGLTTREYKKPGSAAHSWNNRPVPSATDTGLETVGYLTGSSFAPLKERGSTILFRDSPNEWPEKYKGSHALVTRSQAEELLAAERANTETALEQRNMTIAELARLEADNAAKDARIKELEQELTDRKHGGRWSEMVEALEAKLATAEADGIGYRSTIDHLTQRAETAEALVSKWKTAAGRNT